MRRSIALFVLLATLASRAESQQTASPAGEGQPDPLARHLFPPELVMQHQGEINLTDAQRQTLSQAIQQAQGKMLDTQWKLSGEAQKLIRLLQNATIDEAQALEQVDRILTLEREVKRAQMGLMVKIKNTLTPAQQTRLQSLRGDSEARR
jgi:Spy/CpxP family protein refolding chaperone